VRGPGKWVSPLRKRVVDVSYPGPGLQSAMRRRSAFHAAKVSMRDRIGRRRAKFGGCMMIPDVHRPELGDGSGERDLELGKEV
jgi:hypothetical protein